MANKIDLGRLDTIRTPDQWPDIRERRPRIRPSSEGQRPSAHRRVLAVAAAFVIAAAAFALLVTTFRGGNRAPVGTGTPSLAPISPDLVAYVTPDFRIAVVHADGSGQRVLTTGDEAGTASSGSSQVIDEGPQWSQDGATAYFVRIVGGEEWLCSIGADGSDFQVITRNLDGGHIVMSPDGSRFAYDGNDGLLHVIGTDGSAISVVPLRVDGPDGIIWGPNRAAWSPDGNQIAVAGPADGTGRCGNDGCALWVVDLTTGKRMNLTLDEPTQKVESVVWAPNDRIVYASVDFSTTSQPPLRLWTINADGSGRHELPSDGKTVPVGYSPDGVTMLVGRYRSFPYQDDRGLFAARYDESGVAAYRSIVAGAESAFGDWG
jgi:dipeptidyl aminopeptidase/acylaminoacyl peptidase